LQLLPVLLSQLHSIQHTHTHTHDSITTKNTQQLHYKFNSINISQLLPSCSYIPFLFFGFLYASDKHSTDIMESCVIMLILAIKIYYNLNNISPMFTSSSSFEQYARNSPVADKPRDASEVSQGYQTWYHSICLVWFPVSVL